MMMSKVLLSQEEKSSEVFKVSRPIQLNFQGPAPASSVETAARHNSRAGALS